MNILLPTDFSENSRNAAAYAFKYFAGVSCTFHLLHVAPPSIDKAGKNPAAIPSEIQKKFDELFFFPEFSTKDACHSFHFSYKEDYFIEAVRSLVAEKNIDLILMGTKGTTNKEGMIIGKNTSDVITKVKCPALAISQHAFFKANPQMVFPTDYKIQYSAKMLNTLFTLSKLSNSSIRILEFFSSEKEPSAEQIINRTLLYNSFTSGIPPVQTYYCLKNSDRKSLFSTNENVDMIVMAAKNINLCQRLLKNNSKNQIPFINKLPMLVLHG